MRELEIIINKAFNCDIHNESRVLKNIKGRSLYSFVMKSEEKTLKEIAIDIDLTLSTISNSIKTHWQFYATNPKYRTVTDEILKKRL